MMESIESYSTYLKKLNGEYKDNFEKVEAYCDVILDFDINTREEILSYILDDFLNAQKDNIPIQKIIGNDIIKYCDNVCSDIPFKYRIKKYIKAIEYYSWIVLIFICIQIFNNVPDYSIKKFFYQLCVIILLLLLTKCFFSYFEKVNKKVIEKFQFFIDNNISVDDWKK